MDEIQTIRRLIMAPECDTRGKAAAAFHEYVRSKHGFATVDDLKKSEYYKSLCASPSMKHILEYCELG